MASSVTLLAWGIIQYRDAYQAAGELDNALDSIKWATDYFIKAHTAKYEFYGQVSANLDVCITARQIYELQIVLFFGWLIIG